LRGFANTCKAKEKEKKLYQYNKQLRKKTKPKVDKNIVYNNSSSKFVCVQPKIIMIVNIA
jgi:hypothetical protein